MPALDLSHPSYGDRISKFQRPGNPINHASLRFPSDDEKFWWDTTGDLLAHILAKAGYDDKVKSQFLDVYQKAITSFGPRALHDGKASRFSAMSLDSTPFELGWAYNGSESTVGLGFEPHGPPNDPLAQSTARALIQELGKSPNAQVDLQLFDAIAEALHIRPNNLPTVREKLPPDPKAQRPCHIALGLNISHSGSLTVKAYATSQVKMLESVPVPGVTGTGVHVALSNQNVQNEIASKLIRSLDANLFSSKPLFPVYKVLEEYAKASPSNSPQTIFMFGWDCAKLPDTRLKVYVHKEGTSLKNLRELWTQGGRLTGPEIDEGLEILQELYPLLYDVPEGAPDDYQLKTWYGATHPMVAGFEIRPGASQPMPKLYLEPGKFGHGDLETAKRIGGWYQQRGWTLGKSWADDVQEIFSHLNLSQTKGSHSTLCLTPKGNGELTVTTYLNPLIHTALSD